MDTENLIGLFTTGKTPVGGDNKERLRHIVTSFPFFQMAQVLYARQMYFENDPDHIARLKLASAYTPDRKAMYQLFREIPSAEQNSVIAKSTVAGSGAVADDVTYKFVYTPAGDIAAAPVSSSIEPEAVHHIKEAEKPLSLSETFLEKEIAAAAAVALAGNRIGERTTVNSAENKDLTRGKATLLQIVNKDDCQSFSGWLMQMPMSGLGINLTEQKKALEKPKEAFDIINRFITKEPSITKPKAEFFSPAKAAKLSIESDNIPVTETLAQIYMEQGNLPVALKAYQTLLLQNPEKRAYFAARIKEMGNLIELGKSKNK